MGEVDYQKLCEEIFGTSEVKKLRHLADELKRYYAQTDETAVPPEPVKVGRKKKFTEEEVKTMKALLESGVRIGEIAKEYQTSRQVIGRYLNPPMKENCTMRLTYMYEKSPCTVMDVDFLDKKIWIQNRTDDVLFRAFGANESPTWEDFECFLRDRCVSPGRGDINQILKDLGLTDYDPLQIVEKTGGRMAGDHMWLKFRYRSRAHADD